MRDNKEGGPRNPGSARQTAAPAATATSSEPDARNALDVDAELDTRPPSADMQQFIGRQLRAVFDDVAKQPIPDRFLQLMKQLDSKTGAR